jgi:hypothetical protein
VECSETFAKSRSAGGEDAAPEPKTHCKREALNGEWDRARSRGGRHHTATVSALDASPISQREITIKEFYHLDEMDMALRDFVLSLRA